MRLLTNNTEIEHRKEREKKAAIARHFSPGNRRM